MKDEVLKKLNNTDSAIIPRYEIILPDGTVLASGVQIKLMNQVLEPGTPLNKQNLLSDDTSEALGLNPSTSTPDEAFRTIRKSIGYCPKVDVDYFEGGIITVRHKETWATKEYVVPSPGTIRVDVQDYAGYRIYGTFDDEEEEGEDLIVDTTKLYHVDLRKRYHEWLLITPNSKQASFTVTHESGFVLTEEHHAAPSFYLPRAGTYTATAIGLYDGLPSNTYTLTVTEEDLDLKKVTVTNMTWP